MSTADRVKAIASQNLLPAIYAHESALISVLRDIGGISVHDLRAMLRAIRRAYDDHAVALIRWYLRGAVVPAGDAPWAVSPRIRLMSDGMADAPTGDIIIDAETQWLRRIGSGSGIVLSAHDIYMICRALRVLYAPDAADRWIRDGIADIRHYGSGPATVHVRHVA